MNDREKCNDKVTKFDKKKFRIETSNYLSNHLSRVFAVFDIMSNRN